MEARPRILHVYKDYWPPVIGGAERSINLMCRATGEEFDPSVLVSNRRGRSETERIDGVTVVKAATFGRWLSAPLSPGLAGWIRRLPADLIHVHLPNPMAVVGMLWARPSVPVVVTWHSDIVRQAWALAAYRPFLYRFLRGVKRILPTSPQYASSSVHLQRFAEKCEVVPLAIDVGSFSLGEGEGASVDRLRKEKKRPAIAFVGVLRYYKGLEFLIRALADVDAEAWLIGEGPERERLSRLADEIGVGDRVRFLGRLSDEDLRLRLHAADVYCLPSHLRSEAFGLNQIEAMACGLPVVSTSVGGVGYVNLDGTSGLVVPAGDSAALALALNRLLKDGALRGRLGDGALRRARKEFDIPSLGRNLSRVYRDVLGIVPGKP